MEKQVQIEKEYGTKKKMETSPILPYKSKEHSPILKNKHQGSAVHMEYHKGEIDVSIYAFKWGWNLYGSKHVQLES